MVQVELWKLIFAVIAFIFSTVVVVGCLFSEAYK